MLETTNYNANWKFGFNVTRTLDGFTQVFALMMLRRTSDPFMYSFLYQNNAFLLKNVLWVFGNLKPIKM